MELFLMQHGVCLPKELEPDQPLSPVGYDQVERTGTALRRMGADFDAILCSPKTRSYESAQVVAQCTGFPEKAIRVTEAVKAMAPPSALFDLLQEQGNLQSVFVAGHLPHLGEVVSMLITDHCKVAIQIENAGLLRLEVLNFERPAGTLLWYLTPGQLKLLSGI